MSDGTRTCSVEGCGKVHRARGLCSSHYNQAKGYARNLVEVECDWCGQPCMKDKGRENRYLGLFCSSGCRTQWLKLEELGQYAPRSPAPPSSTLPPDHPVRMVGKSCPVEYRECDECGGTMADPRRHRFCSSACLEKQRTKRRKGRRRSKTKQLWDQVAAVHGTDCVVCGDPVDLDARPNQLDSPTVDHVLARKNGGTDDVANLRFAHMYCNSYKRDLDLAEVAC